MLLNKSFIFFIALSHDLEKLSNFISHDLVTLSIFLSYDEEKSFSFFSKLFNLPSSLSETLFSFFQVLFFLFLGCFEDDYC